LLVLVQVPPLAQESGEGVPINKVEQQGAITSSKAMKQQWGGVGGTWKRVAGCKSKNNKTWVARRKSNSNKVSGQE
jgi:hypothetical protein